jgi:hypothetical protein
MPRFQAAETLETQINAIVEIFIFKNTCFSAYTKLTALQPCQPIL